MLKTAVFLLLSTFYSFNLYSQELVIENFIKNDTFTNIEPNFSSQREINIFYKCNISLKKMIQNSDTLIDSIITISSNGSKGKILINYSNSIKITSLTFYFLQSGLWIKSQKLTNTYDSLGRISYSLNEIWNGISWSNYSCNYFTYDSYDNITSNILKSWNGMEWENILRISNNFNSDGNLIISLTEKFYNDKWNKSSKLTNEFYPNRLKSSTLYQVFENDEWRNKIYTVFQYDDSDKLITILNQEWDVNNWDNYIRIIFDYSLNTQQTTQLIETWDNNQWKNYARYLYQYNSFDYLEYALFDLWENNNWIADDGNIYISNPDGFGLHFLAHEIYLYYNSVSYIGFNENNNLSYFELLQNYPNPFNPKTTINYVVKERGFIQLQVYDLLGTKVATLVNEEKRQGSYSVSFDGSNLPSGVYIYSLNVNDFTQNRKMILLK